MNGEDLFAAYEKGLADGYYAGVETNPYTDDYFRSVYRRGYDRGVAMFCDTLEDDDSKGPCLCGRGECPECGNG